jgi:heme A synthase
MLAQLLHWLVTPISGASDHAIAMPLAWHGRLMVLAMGLLTPPLIIVARFFKIMPRQDWPRQLDNPFWFITHRRWGHIVGAIVAIAMAFVLVERGWESPLNNLHTATGWLVVVLVLVQLVGSWLRGTHGGPVDPFTRKPRPRELWPGDHFSMTRRRIIFEHIHKGAGYLLLALTVLALCTGLIAADAPRWMPIVLGALVAGDGGRFCVVAARRPLHRYLPGDLGPRSGSSGQPPAADRLWYRARAVNERIPARAGI